MKSAIPAFLTPKTHIFPIPYFTLPAHSGNVGNATGVIVFDLDHVW